MASERTTETVCDMLYAQATCLWGKDDAERQRPGLQRAAEEITMMDHYRLPPDLEPRFF